MAIPCQVQPSPPPFGTFAACNPTPHGGTCGLTCANAYQPGGDAVCNQGQWSTPVCVPIPGTAAPAPLPAPAAPTAMGPLVNVRDHGAVCDGWTDDTAAIQAAFSAVAAAGGGTVFFPRGYCNVAASIPVPSNTAVQGVSSMDAGACQLRFTRAGGLNATDLPLFVLPAGTRNVVFRDLEIRSMTPGPNVYPRNDLDRIRDEGTAAIRVRGVASDAPVEDVWMENVRFVDFTAAVDVGTAPAVVDPGPTVRNIQLRNVAMGTNRTGLNLDSFNVSNLEAQNLNVWEMGTAQDGVVVKRAGDNLAFFQLSCASTLHNAASCVDLHRHGRIFLRNSHTEGPQYALRVRDSGTGNGPVVLQETALAAGFLVEGARTFYSVANTYGLAGIPAAAGSTPVFAGAGTASVVNRCLDVFLDPTDPDPSHARVDIAMDGLPADLPRCGFALDAMTVQFSAGALPAVGDHPAAVNVRTLGAVGDGQADDTAVLQAAVDAALGGGTIHIPAGTYRVTRSLELWRGVILEGAPGATLLLDAPGVALLRIRILAGAPIITRSVVVRDLALQLANGVTRDGTVGVEFSGNLGASTDFQLVRLHVSGFGRGVLLTPDVQSNYEDPMVDSVALRELTLDANGIGLELLSHNGSNWNVENLNVTGMLPGQSGVRLKGASLALRGLRCAAAQPAAPADVCLDVLDHGILPVDDLAATGVNAAVRLRWQAGYFPNAVILRNSWLVQGVILDGAANLVSLNNVYAVGGVQVGVTAVDNPRAGETSNVASCGDRVLDVTAGQVSPAPAGLFQGLLSPPRFCP